MVIERVIAWCARRRALTLVGVALGFAAGLVALSRTSLDAIPDLSDTQVIVATEWAGKSPDLIEDQVTYPIVTTLRAAPGVRYVRGFSMLGDSYVYVVFKDGVDGYWARSRVLELLAQVESRLPQGAVPRLGPDATGVGWVYEYALVDTSGRHDLSELRALQDWTVRAPLAAVDGVAEVAAVGGFVRRFEVALDPARLAAYGVSVGQVAEALKKTSGDSGAGVLEVAGHEVVVRGRGYVTTLADVASTPVRADAAGVPLTVAQLGDVRMGPEPRRGIATLDDKGEVVGGVVVMRQGQNALTVIRGVKARLAEIARTLPPGVTIVPTYDRSTLIEGAVHTLTSRLVEEMAIVSLVILLFLFHVRSALIPILSLPVAVVLAFLPMHVQGLNANLMSLGGIAVAIGAMVDASIIMIENVHKRLEEWDTAGRPGARDGVIVHALQEVGRPVFFALLVIAVSFLPVFTLEAQEGRLFRPLAFTKTWAMTFAALLAVTLTRGLGMVVGRGKIRPEREQPVARWFIRIYTPVLRWTVRRRRWVIAGAALLVLTTIPAFLSLGVEFMPPLNEGTLLYMPTAPPGMSDSEASSVLQTMGRLLKDVPEVERVFGKIGRAKTATDPAPPGMVETVIALRPEREWRPGMTWEKLVAELDRRVSLPGMPNLWWMPIQTRNEMLATGVRSAIGIKVFGPDLPTIERLSLAVEEAVRSTPGVRSAFAERLTGATYFDVTVRRDDAARYGLTVADVEDAVEAATSGITAGQTVDGRARYALAVRYAPELGDSPEALARVLVPTSTGAMVPLSQVATLSFTTGPPMIQDEDGQLVGLVSLDVAGRALDRVVRDTKARVAARVELPPGTRLEWAGQYQHLVRAERRLAWVIPLTLLIVTLLLWLNLRSFGGTAIVLLAVPFSLVGAVWLVWLLGFNLSVAVWVGMIALAGLDAETGTLMLLYLNLATRDRLAKGRLNTRADLAEAIVEGAAHRIRPKHMTVLAILFGLLPILFGHGPGSDVMQRIAAPMVGGVVSSFVLELLVYPAVYAWWKGRHLPEGALS
jgi:Cu(I)/Ag(I) efflux system membrane protein CusA/SilA